MSDINKLHNSARRLLRRTVVVLLLTATVVCAARPSASDDFTDRRLTIGARIFRAMLAADLDLEKKVTATGKLNLYLLYVNDPKGAAVVANTLINRDDPRIRNNRVHIKTLSYAEWLAESADRCAGVFLTQPLDEGKLTRLLANAGRHHTLVFSPFEGDIERGVTGGIAVEARVRPYLNLTAMRKAGIRLKSFFMEVAKKHE